jgi:hypothetical protein
MTAAEEAPTLPAPTMLIRTPAIGFLLLSSIISAGAHKKIPENAPGYAIWRKSGGIVH